MPISPEFKARSCPRLRELVARYPTPFHVYDERGLVESHLNLTRAFGGTFRNYFAVKSLPNPAVLKRLLDHGSGLDCSSPVELELARRLGAGADDIVFTSNNTSLAEYRRALEVAALITLDDVSMLRSFRPLPPILAFRIAPSHASGDLRMNGPGGASKFGIREDQAEGAYREAFQRGIRRFGIHSMALANTIDDELFARASCALVETAARLSKRIGIEFEYINLGGGLGIPYRPGENAFDVNRYASAVVSRLHREFSAGPVPKLIMECGRYITGPHGVLVTTVLNVCEKARRVVGVDASMSALMRPGMYRDAYHDITSPFAGNRTHRVVDVVGSLCEGNDVFGRDRTLPEPRVGDILLIHDTGAHGHSMGFNYNGRLRPGELLLCADDCIREIRRPETYEDYVATVRWLEQPVLAEVVDA